MSNKFALMAVLFLVCTKSGWSQTSKYDIIPQKSAAEMAKMRAERLSENKLGLEMYDKVGTKNAKWDDDVRKGLSAFAIFLAQSQNISAKELGFKHLEKAIKAGCTDPLVRYMYIRNAPKGIPEFSTLKEIAEYFEKVAQDMEASQYSPEMKARSRLFATLFGREAKLLMNFDIPASKMRGFIEAALKDTDPKFQRRAYDLCSDYLTMYFALSKMRQQGFDQLMPIVNKEPAFKRVGLMLTGSHYIEYAWEARGNGPASTVSKEGFQLFRDRLKLAEDALEAAWKLSPKEPDQLSSLTAIKMMVVEKGQGKGRDRLELWFQRAMKADPDSVLACQMKMSYLEPKWHGNVQAMLQFGQLCVKTQNWEGYLPFALTAAHDQIAEYLEPQARPKYYQTPTVKKDFQTVFEAHLKKHPEDRFTRSAYLKKLILMSDGVKARKQWQALGNEFSIYANDAAEITALRKALEALEGGAKK